MRHSDEAFATIGTSLGPLLLSAAHMALQQAQTAADLADELQPSVAAILCAAAAVEASTNWAADQKDGWLDAALPAPGRGTRADLPPDRKWAAWLETRGAPVDLGTGLGQRVVSLIADRNLIAHFRGVRGADGKRSFHLPPDARNDNRSRVRTYFAATRAATHVQTAEEAIAELR